MIVPDSALNSVKTRWFYSGSRLAKALLSSLIKPNRGVRTPFLIILLGNLETHARLVMLELIIP